MIQVQDWNNPKGYKRILITSERDEASVQVNIFEEEIKQRYEGADALIYALWVNAPFRRQGVGAYLLHKAEEQAKAFGCKTVCLTWDDREAPQWVYEWYARQGYEDTVFDDNKILMTKGL